MQRNLRVRSQGVSKEKRRNKYETSKITQSPTEKHWTSKHYMSDGTANFSKGNQNCKGIESSSNVMNQKFSDDDCIIVYNKKEADQCQITRSQIKETEMIFPQQVIVKRINKSLQRNNKSEETGNNGSEQLFKSLRQRVIKYHHVFPFEERKSNKKTNKCKKNKHFIEEKDSRYVDLINQKHCKEVFVKLPKLNITSGSVKEGSITIANEIGTGSFKVSKSQDNQVQKENYTNRETAKNKLNDSKKDCKNLSEGNAHSLVCLKCTNLESANECKEKRKTFPHKSSECTKIREDPTPETIISEPGMKEKMVSSGNIPKKTNNKETEESSCDKLDKNIRGKELTQPTVSKQSSVLPLATDASYQSEGNSHSSSQERPLSETNIDSFEHALKELEKCLEDCDKYIYHNLPIPILKNTSK